MTFSTLECAETQLTVTGVGLAIPSIRVTFYSTDLRVKVDGVKLDLTKVRVPDLTPAEEKSREEMRNELMTTGGLAQQTSEDVVPEETEWVEYHSVLASAPGSKLKTSWHENPIVKRLEALSGKLFRATDKQAEEIAESTAQGLARSDTMFRRRTGNLLNDKSSGAIAASYKGVEQKAKKFGHKHTHLELGFTALTLGTSLGFEIAYSILPPDQVVAPSPSPSPSPTPGGTESEGEELKVVGDRMTRALTSTLDDANANQESWKRRRLRADRISAALSGVGLAIPSVSATLAFSRTDKDGNLISLATSNDSNQISMSQSID